MVTPPLTPAERAAELYPKDAAAELNERDIITDAERSAYIRGDAEGYARAIEALAAAIEAYLAGVKADEQMQRYIARADNLNAAQSPHAPSASATSGEIVRVLRPFVDAAAAHIQCEWFHADIPVGLHIGGRDVTGRDLQALVALSARLRSAPSEGAQLPNPAGGIIPTTQGNARRADAETGESPVASAPTSQAETTLPAALTSPSPPEGALKPPFEWYGEADVADRHGHIFTAENREIADALFAALSTPPTDTVAVPRETLRQVIYWLKNSSLQPHPNAVGSGEADPNEAPLKLAAEIYRLLQGENDARARAVAAGKEQP